MRTARTTPRAAAPVWRAGSFPVCAERPAFAGGKSWLNHWPIPIVVTGRFRQRSTMMVRLAGVVMR